MSSALSAVTDLSKSAQMSGRIIALTEQDMIDLVTPAPTVEESSWSVPPLFGKPEVLKLREGGEEMVQRFKMEVAELRRRLPPGLGDTNAWAEMVGHMVFTEWQFLHPFSLHTMISRSSDTFESAE